MSSKSTIAHLAYVEAYLHLMQARLIFKPQAMCFSLKSLLLQEIDNNILWITNFFREIRSDGTPDMSSEELILNVRFANSISAYGNNAQLKDLRIDNLLLFGV